METNAQKSILRFVPCIAALMFLIYIIGTTAVIVTQFKLAVSQSERLDVLERQVKTLTKQVEDRVAKPAAWEAKRQPKGETAKPVRPRTSDRVEDRPGELNEEDESNRSKRQFGGAGCPCLQGRPGRKGRRGRNGARGPPGPPGPSGLAGRNGPKGLKGEDGVPGKDGAHGQRGSQGPPGFNGTQGQKGEPGPPGPLVSESIHLQGNGNKVRLQGENRETNWKLSPNNPKQGNITYSPTGFIVVARKGYYFVYSQMYYYDGSALMMGHLTYINENKVMESMGSVISETKKYNTKYHGGVFLLDKGDKISIRHPFTKYYYMSATGSFFGDPAEVREWTMKNKSGSITYHSLGIIEIKKPGYYYLYSQMNYYDESRDTFHMQHGVFVNGQKVLESSSGHSKIENDQIPAGIKHTTNYNGGVFLLEFSDQVSVRNLIGHKEFFMKPSASYFGAFMLYPTQQ